MRFTQWFNFKKPEPFDTVNINDLNDSFDLIDEKLKETVDENKNLSSTFKELIINAGNSNAEIVDARVDQGGLSFPKLGDRLDNISSKVNNVQYTKMDKSGIFTMANMGQDIKEAMTGGSVAVVGKDAILAENIVDHQVISSKISEYSIKKEHIQGKGDTIEIMDDLRIDVEGKYITNDGIVTPLQDWYIIKSFKVEGKITIVGNKSLPILGCWVDSNGSFIEAIVSTKTEQDGLYIHELLQPRDSRSTYIKLNYNKEYYVSISMVKTTGVISTKHINEKDFRIGTPNLDDYCITNNKLATSKSKNLLPYTIQYDGRYLNTEGELISLAGWGVTHKIDVSSISKIVLTTTQKPLYLGCWYNENDVYLNNISYEEPKEDNGVFTTEIIPPKFNVKYIRLNIWNNILKIEHHSEGCVNTENIFNGSITMDKLNEEVKSFFYTGGKSYCNLEYTRECISDLLYKWRCGVPLNIVCLGDSITNFQNSEILNIEDQKNAPLGLQGNSWVRRLWKILNYDVYNDDRSIRNENGNLGYKRYDHPDFIFEGGYQGLNNSIGNYKWATNRSDSPDSWRNVNFAGYPQNITPESSYNKMFVGSKTVGAKCTVTIPSSAIKMSLVLGRCTAVVNIKINNGSQDVYNEDITINGEAYELHKEFNLTTGTNKTITLTLVSGTIWLYGIEYWSSNCVRVINSGLAGNSVDSVNNSFNLLLNGFNGNASNVDLIVWEVNALNDARNPLSSTLTNAKEVFEKIKALNIPVLAIMTHRHENGQVTLQYDRYNPLYDSNFPSGSKLVNNKHFYPDYVRLYKTLAYKYKAGIIDMFSKSVDITGGELKNKAVFPLGFFVDGIHLGIKGNDSYEEELRNIFMWDDLI